jgi:hypothetical protein
MSIKSLAPIVLFVYNRPNHTKRTIEALCANHLASESELFIYSDAPKNEIAKADVQSVRVYIQNVSGFKKINIVERNQNFGLVKSITEGVTEIINIFGKIIILDDDLLTHPQFLNFMNESLELYKNVESVYSITGYSHLKQSNFNELNHLEFIYLTSTWSWATWKDRWFLIDWNVSDFEAFIKDTDAKKRFNFGGSDMVKMLKDWKHGYIDAWDIRFSYGQFKYNGYTIFPVVSKVQNIGFDKDATHTDVFNRYKTKIDTINKRFSNLPTEVVLIESFVKQFQVKFSIASRIIGRIKTALGMR